MANLSFSKEELLNEINGFVEAYSNSLSPFFLSAQEEKGEWLKDVVLAGYDLITFREWDQKIALEEGETILNLLHLEAQEFLEPMLNYSNQQTCENASMELITEVCEKSVRIIERWNDKESPWSIEELQFFCGLSTQSIRNAKNSTGSDRLEFNIEGKVDYDKGISWLRTRASYKGLEDEVTNSIMENFRFNRYRSLDLLNKHRSEFLGLSDSFLPKDLLTAPYTLGSNWRFVSPNVVLDICEVLRYSPKSFFKTFLEMNEYEASREFEELLESKEHGVILDTEASEKEIKQLILSAPEKFERHPKNKPSNTKMGVFYCSGRKVCFAHEFNLKNNQHIWVRKNDLSKEFLQNIFNGVFNDKLKYKDSYPQIDSATINSGSKGRHSSLLISDELASTELLRLTPKTMNMVKLILKDLGCIDYSI